MDAKTFMALTEEVNGLEELLREARVKMKETMSAGDYEANRNWAQAVSRLENEISSKRREMKK
jgi:hypothetical protein